MGRGRCIRDRLTTKVPVPVRAWCRAQVALQTQAQVQGWLDKVWVRRDSPDPYLDNVGNLTFSQHRVACCQTL